MNPSLVCYITYIAQSFVLTRRPFYFVMSASPLTGDWLGSHCQPLLHHEWNHGNIQPAYEANPQPDRTLPCLFSLLRVQIHHSQGGGWDRMYFTQLITPVHVQGVKWSVVSVCLSVTKNTSPPDQGRSSSAKYLQTVRDVGKLPCLCFFLLDMQRILQFELALCVYVYWPHPDTWPPVQCETTVSVFTIQRTFVRWRFASVLKEPHACALQSFSFNGDRVTHLLVNIS